MTVVRIPKYAERTARARGMGVEGLGALARALAGVADTAVVAATLLDMIAKNLGPIHAGVFVCEQRDGRFEPLATIGHMDEPQKPSQRLQECLAACQRAGEPIVRDDLLAAPLLSIGAVLAAIPSAGTPQEDIAAHLEAYAACAGLAFEAASLREQASKDQTTERELALAAEIQRNLLPTIDMDRWPVFGLNRPIHRVSGDFFDFFALPDGRIPFALGDVSGKGINAALLMAKAASLFRCLGKRHDSPAAILEAINRELLETVSRGMFVTMVAGLYDPRAGYALISNAGHEPPLLRHRDRSYLTFPASAPPLGILPDVVYANEEISLEGGELYMFSDGLTEFGFRDQERLGVKGLIQMVEALSSLPLEARLETLLAELECEGWRVRDDLTVLAIDDSWTPLHKGGLTI